MNATATRRPEDGFERYYTEKLWAWLPEVYKDEDGRADNPGVLRALIGVIAGQAAVVRRDVDLVWSDQAIETADDWALTYLGDLLGTRPVSALNARGQRVNVGRTVAYRRRQGTPRLTATLLRDIGDLDGIVVESFRRLARCPHRLDIAHLPGPVTATPVGGTARLTTPRIADIVDGPFDDLAHLADLRQLQGFQGRYGINKVNAHLYALQAFLLENVTPVDLGAGRYVIDPSGRDVALFQPRQPPQGGDGFASPAEWQVPAAITCRRLNDARFRLGTNEADPGLRALAAFLFPSLAAFRRLLGARPDFPDLVDRALVAACPRAGLWTEAVAIAVGPSSAALPFASSHVTGANLAAWGAGLVLAPEQDLAIDPERGRLWLPAGAPAVGDDLFVQRHHYGFSDEIGAGGYGRTATMAAAADSIFDAGLVAPDGGFEEPGPVGVGAIPAAGVRRFGTSRTYAVTPTSITGITALTLDAADQQRPYVTFAPPAADAVALFEAASDDPADGHTLVLDGLWLGLRPPDFAALPLAAEGDPVPPVTATLALHGAFRRVVIRNCTLDPGGEGARTDPLLALAIPGVRLELRGQVDELVIERSITGPIVERSDDDDTCSARRILICDSIVQSRDPAIPAIATRIAEVVLDRVTVFGAVTVNRLFATEALVQGIVRVTDNQRGCFRFSATGADPALRLPRQYESHLLDGGIPNHAFTSRRFGDAGFAQLSPTAPGALLRGAENRAELGAFNRRLAAIRRDDLTAKLYEHLPFGLLVQLILES